MPLFHFSARHAAADFFAHYAMISFACFRLRHAHCRHFDIISLPRRYFHSFFRRHFIIIFDIIAAFDYAMPADFR